MSILEITVQFRKDETHASQALTLDGVRFRLDSYTNKSDGSWYIDLYDEDNAALVQGIAIATGLDLLYPYRYLDIPAGVLFVNDQTGEPRDPTLDTFLEDQAVLYYQTADEALTSQADF